MPISTKLFSYDARTSNLAAEASTVEFNGNRITVTSHRTGRDITFETVNTHRDSENDITHWTLRPIDRTLPVSMTIFND